jgi:ribosomal protein S17E
MKDVIMAKTKTTRRPLSAKTCKQIAKLMADYLTDKLRPKVKEDFEKHLNLCPDCVNFFNTYKKTVQSTAILRAKEIPPKVRDNILGFLRQKLRAVSALVIYLIAHLTA